MNETITKQVQMQYKRLTCSLRQFDPVFQTYRIDVYEFGKVCDHCIDVSPEQVPGACSDEANLIVFVKGIAMNDTAQSDWVDVADSSEFSAGMAKEFVIGANVIAVFHDGESLYALDGLCAHQGGPIAKGTLSTTDAGKTCVTCPWHGWQYELETGIQTVNRQPLQRTFPLRVREGRIEIQITN